MKSNPSLINSAECIPIISITNALINTLTMFLLVNNYVPTLFPHTSKCTR